MAPGLVAVRRRSVLVVAGEGVVVDARAGVGVDVHGGVVEAWDLVVQLVFGGVGDGVGGDDVEGAVDGHGRFGVHTVPDPPQPDLVDSDDSRGGGQCRLGLVDQGWSTASIRRR